MPISEDRRNGWTAEFKFLTYPLLPHKRFCKSSPSPELWQSGKRLRRFPSGRSPRLFHARGYDHACKLGWRSVAEAAVWPLFVVFRLPVSHFPACIEQVREPTDPQALLAQSAVRAEAVFCNHRLQHPFSKLRSA